MLEGEGGYVNSLPGYIACNKPLVRDAAIHIPSSDELLYVTSLSESMASNLAHYVCLQSSATNSTQILCNFKVAVLHITFSTPTARTASAATALPPICLTYNDYHHMKGQELSSSPVVCKPQRHTLNCIDRIDFVLTIIKKFNLVY
jgi:hypothetical protein